MSPGECARRRRRGGRARRGALAALVAGLALVSAIEPALGEGRGRGAGGAGWSDRTVLRVPIPRALDSAVESVRRTGRRILDDDPPPPRRAQPEPEPVFEPEPIRPTRNREEPTAPEPAPEPEFADEAAPAAEPAPAPPAADPEPPAPATEEALARAPDSTRRTGAIALAVLAALGLALAAFALARRRRGPGVVAAAPASPGRAERASTIAAVPAAALDSVVTRPRVADGARTAARASGATRPADRVPTDVGRALDGAGLEAAGPDALEEAARLLADAGRFDEAIAALVALQAREPERPLATRIEVLRKRRSAREARTTAPRLTLAAARPPGRRIANRYDLLAEVGRGGMGVVWRARDTRLDRVVALKQLSESFREHPRAVELLLREARSAAGLTHPNIVVVHDVDQDPEDGSYFLTMEYLEGKPLSAVLAARGRLGGRAVAWLGRQAAAGLAYAHERRIVHRDVKTANLFLTRDRALKIMDFGLAKVVEAVRRRATLIGGTPSYMAPEQAAGLAADGRADLYALGVTLFELATGELPFETDGFPDRARAAEPPDPREHVAALDAALAELVLHLLAPRPDDRPATAGEVAARLQAIERALAKPEAGAASGA